MTRKYFGTDGIRGEVGRSPMTADFILHLGQAAGRLLASDGPASVLIGKDTRISGYMFESALEAGFVAAGVNVYLLGPLPTPGIAYLTKTFRASAGVVISASHNAYPDNGIKLFSPDGCKLADELEDAIERALDEPFQTVASEALGKAERVADAQGRYVEFCKSTFGSGMTLSGLRIALDCANGATYQVAPFVFRELGAETVVMGADPDGFNINRDCGSTQPDALRQLVLESGADVGLAFDGDGDRVIMVDHEGRLLDGDDMLYILVCALSARGELRGPVVGTEMSNLGLEQALTGMGIPFRRTRVGDRYVQEMLRREGGTLGAEPSGHVLCLDRMTTGDGIVTALQVLGVMVGKGCRLADLLDGLHKYPQTLISIRNSLGAAALDRDGVRAAVTEVEGELGSRGRVVLRPSGTEPLVRVMVEGEDRDRVAGHAQHIADAVRAAE